MKISTFAFLGLLAITHETIAQEIVTVNSQEEWKTIVFEEPVTRISSITGGWNVDKNNYNNVGSYGHYGSSAQSLKPWNHLKFDKKYPFGALLVNLDELGYIHVTGPMELEEPVNQIKVRINDKALGDNSGNLIVIFE